MKKKKTTIEKLTRKSGRLLIELVDASRNFSEWEYNKELSVEELEKKYDEAYEALAKRILYLERQLGIKPRR